MCGRHTACMGCAMTSSDAVCRESLAKEIAGASRFYMSWTAAHGINHEASTLDHRSSVCVLPEDLFCLLLLEVPDVSPPLELTLDDDPEV